MGKKNNKKKETEPWKRLNRDDNANRSVVKSIKAFPDSSINDSSKDFAEDPNSLEHGEDGQRNLTEKSKSEDAENQHHLSRNLSLRSTETFQPTLKQRAESLLEKYSNIQPMEMCRILDLNYKKYGATMSSYKSDWKKSKSEKRLHLFRLSMHRVRFFGYALKQLDLKVPRIREAALAAGWCQTRAYNKMIVWKSPKRLGRVTWFRTGRINCWVKKPANKGKLMQLLANAFCKTDLVSDIKVFMTWAETFRLKGAKLVYKTGQVLPYARISLLKDSNGVIVLMGDSSHPDALEIQFIYPTWAERNELLFEQTLKALQIDAEAFQQLSKMMKDLTTPKPLSSQDRSMVV